jgi:hypothetical protein
MITGRLAAAHAGDYTIAFYGVTIAAGVALASVVLLDLIYKPVLRRHHSG